VASSTQAHKTEAVAETCGEHPGRRAPRYCLQCHRQELTLEIQHKASGKRQYLPYKCGSWRHPGECARKRAAQDYARIRDALEPFPASSIVYMVLTIDPKRWTADGYDRARRRDAKKAIRDKNAIDTVFRELSRCWQRFSREFKKAYGFQGWVGTVEVTKNGWPHLNIVAVSPELAACAASTHRRCADWSQDARGREAGRRWIGEMCEAAGFGEICFVEPIHDKGKIADYITKLAGDHGGAYAGKTEDAGGLVAGIDDRTVAEIAKLSQLPYDAAKNFRRLRSSKGFLPAKRGSGEYTGALRDRKTGRELGKPSERKEFWSLVAATMQAYNRAKPGEAKRKAGQAMDRAIATAVEIFGRERDGPGVWDPETRRQFPCESMVPKSLTTPPGELARTYRLRPLDSSDSSTFYVKPDKVES